MLLFLRGALATSRVKCPSWIVRPHLAHAHARALWDERTGRDGSGRFSLCGFLSGRCSALSRLSLLGRCWCRCRGRSLGFLVLEGSLKLGLEVIEGADCCEPESVELRWGQGDTRLTDARHDVDNGITTARRSVFEGSWLQGTL